MPGACSDRPGDHVVLAGHHRLEALPRDVAGSAFLPGRSWCCHVRAIEELGVSGAGLQRGHRDPGVRKLVAQRLSKHRSNAVVAP